MAVTVDQAGDAAEILLDQPVQRMPFVFTGNAGEYFGIWIVNPLLSIITFGIDSAWAKIRMARYRIEQMELVADGDLDTLFCDLRKQVEAYSDEISEGFDLDMGFGV